ncbi:cellulose biosynthesis protein BcsR [Erwiniaceae bacterium BAC15a-03b]|uniref:Cellulose biosynthesis protein BcsR n=1 Tax=Winslowiella arboricola TaxID=2978220 RepID=A0A9J6PLU0_9GAMM|nr:cellulose biosynthesis protein BcsR [Winslowiella arboricola]MCU5773832.1 cellulose biosynthesis protein BcsR [Winslowiella arboricola]MCU5777742.1 cellulose biosynthesis protein BcsR [Winslowiella arboricola]
MKKNKNIPTVVNVTRHADDILALSEAFNFSARDYVDIARDERLENILIRWPLLHELANDLQEKGN